MRISAILCLVVFVAACNSDSVPFTPGGFTDAVGADGDSGGLDGGVQQDGVGPADVTTDVPVLNDCQTNGDCVGGEVCRDGFCREVCTVEVGCSGVLPVCDPTSGLCVQCVGADDCDDGLCEDNVCQPVECTEARDCPGGFTCSAGRCIPLEAPCEDGALRCNGTAVQVCTDGVFGVRESCAPRSCEQGPDGPRCETEQCAPNTTRCAGELLAICDETGTVESTVSCDAVPSCVGEQGCVCADGACEPRVCVGGQRRCDGNDVLLCSDDGLSESAVDRCGVGQTCASGACIDEGCDAGASRCDGAALLSCGVDGTWERTDCDETGGVCAAVGGGAACVEPVCTPRSRRCGTTTREVFVCSADGLSERREDCAVGDYCSAGNCIAQQCTPFERYCEGDAAFTCRANGSGGDLTDACGGGEICLDGRCVSDDGCLSASDCPPPEAYCAGRVLVTYSGLGSCIGRECNYDDVQNERDCDLTGRTCQLGPPPGCVTATCETSEDCGGDFCDAGVCVECRSLRDCSDGEFCDGGACEDCGCAANQTCGVDGECVSGDADNCTSNSQCGAIAAALGYTGENAACGANGECYIMGRCGVGILGADGGDVFGRSCQGGLACNPVFDLGGASIFNSCGPCVDDNDCRVGESCLFGLLTDNYCGGPGDGGGGFLP